MLGGRPMSFFTLSTALTASPRDTLGAKLKDRVTTGNCPWWFTVIGTVVCSTREKALSGIWPPAVTSAPAGLVPPALADVADVAAVRMNRSFKLVGFV